MRIRQIIASMAGLGMCAALVWLCFTPALVRAQVTGSSLSGTVNDPSGAPIPGAKVKIENLETGVTRDLTTDKNGYYTAPNLLPGNYGVTVSADGFATQVQKGITLTVGGHQVFNLTLSVGNLNQRVEVTAEAPLVQTTSSDISSVINSTTVRQLPLNGRSWTDLALLSPAVSRVETAFNAASGADRGERGFGTQLSVSGGKPVQNNYRLDGISVNDFANGGPGNALGVSLGVDGIQEFSVITSNYSAEYGRTSGGIINAITRAGTNDFHGSAFEFLRNSALDARNFFDYDPLTGAPIRSPFRRNQFGGSGGGAIRKDSTFIFADYEGIRQAKGVASAVTVPSDVARTGKLFQYTPGCPGGTITSDNACQVAVDPAAAKYLAFWPHAPASRQVAGQDTAQFAFAGQQVLNEDFLTLRLDHKFSERDSMFGTFFYDNDNFSGPDTLDQVLLGHHIDRKALIVEETHMFSQALVNTVRFGYNGVGAYDNQGISAINPLANDTSVASTPGMNAARVNIAGIANFNGGVGSLDHFLNDYKSFQVYDDAFLTRGKHSLKFGVAVERIHNGVTSYGNAAGNWQFGSLEDFLTNKPLNFSSALGAATPRNVRQTIFGLYLQDDWRVLSNLTVNLGLRYEMATVPSEIDGKFSNLPTLTAAQPNLGNPLFSNPTLHNFEPRIGFSWDPLRDGKTAVRGGFGMFDVLPLPYIATFLEYRPAPFYQLGATSTGLDGTFYSGAYSLLAQNPNTLSATYIEPHPNRNYVMQWNLNVQRQLTPSVALMVGYVGSRGVHQQFRVDDANMTLPTLTSAGYLFPATPGLPVLNPSYQGGIRSLWWDGNSSYHALETTVMKNMSHGLQLEGSFTWGKSMDNSSAGVGADSFGNSLSSLHWYSLPGTKAVSDYNVGRTLSINAIWDIPGPKASAGIAYWVFSGWELGGVFTMHDGLPFTPLIGGDPVGQNSTDPFAFPSRLNSPGCTSLVNPGNVDNYVKAQCFTMPTAPSQAFYNANCNPAYAYPVCGNLRGNAGRNILVGPGLVNLDSSLFKNIPVQKISEKFVIQFRAEFFNILNHPNFQAPFDSNVIFNQDGTPASGVGALHSTVTDEREIQFAIKFTW